MFELDWGQLVNAGSGVVSLFLATQIRMVVKNHEVRIRALEAKRKTKRRKRAR